MLTIKQLSLDINKICSYDELMTTNFYPARLHQKAVAELLGFAEHDIPVLVSKKFLKPLAKPVQSAVKYFAACDVTKLAQDSTWLNKATQAVYDYWKAKNANKTRNRNTVPSSTIDSQPTNSPVTFLSE